MIDPEGLHGLFFFGKGPMMFRTPVSRTITRINRGLPRQMPKKSPDPKLRPIFEPPPDIVKPGPWAEFLRLLGEFLSGSGGVGASFVPPMIDQNDNSTAPCEDSDGKNTLDGVLKEKGYYDPITNPEGII